MDLRMSKDSSLEHRLTTSSTDETSVQASISSVPHDGQERCVVLLRRATQLIASELQLDLN